MGFIYTSRLGMEHRNFMATVVDTKLVLPHVYSPLCLQVFFFSFFTAMPFSVSMHAVLKCVGKVDLHTLRDVKLWFI